MIWSGALMLEFLGQGDERHQRAHDAILNAIETVIQRGQLTPDMKGTMSTQQVGKEICELISAM
ncbi:Tartrate dehydrogenase/decarboxylase [compost metagenome]